jgi:hypothetical protein
MFFFSYTKTRREYEPIPYYIYFSAKIKAKIGPAKFVCGSLTVFFGQSSLFYVETLYFCTPFGKGDGCSGKAGACI